MTIYSMTHEYKIEDLPPDMQTASLFIGVQNTVKLMQGLGGQNLYVPKLDRLENRKKIGMYIKENFNGINVREICDRINISRSTFYNYLNNHTFKRTKK